MGFASGPSTPPFGLSVLTRNEEGYIPVPIGGQNFGLTSGFKDYVDLTPTGGNQVLPTTAEQWEIVSESADDSSVGIGARTVAVSTLDGDYKPQITLVVLNGTTPVALDNTHLRSQSAILLTSGSDPSNTNIGDIIMRVAGGGTERMRIPAGIGDCKSLLFTIPAETTGFGTSFTLFTSKNRDFTIRSKLTPFGGATITGGEVSTYQTISFFPIVAPFPLPAKTDIRIEVKSSNPSTEVLVFTDLLLVDNSKLKNIPDFSTSQTRGIL